MARSMATSRPLLRVLECPLQAQKRAISLSTSHQTSERADAPSNILAVLLVPSLKEVEASAVDACSDQLRVVNGTFGQSSDPNPTESPPNRALELATGPRCGLPAAGFQCSRVRLRCIQRIQAGYQRRVVIPEHDLILPSVARLLSPEAVATIGKEGLR